MVRLIHSWTVLLYVVEVIFIFATGNALYYSANGFGIGIPSIKDASYPSSANCTENFFEQEVDHFSYATNLTYKQRFFTYDKFWQTQKDGKHGPIFFYVGNEADVTLYINASGLMWENAPAFGALLVFAEHRFYGESQPFKGATNPNLGYLSSEQALADYAVLINSLKLQLNCPESPVIAFGGSYGGMLATWMRIKYPHVIEGAIAASAPIWHFLGDSPSPDPYAYYSIITRAASKEGGSSDSCKEGVRATWEPFFSFGSSIEGREELSRSFGLCDELQSLDEVQQFALWIQNAWSSMAMGNYPFPSSYLLSGQAVLPAWPIKVACSHFEDVDPQGPVHELFSAHRQAIATFYNASGDQTCFDWQSAVNDEDEITGNHWDYQYCTEMFMPVGTNGITDMFWPSYFNEQSEVERCYSKWGVRPRLKWAWTQYGGHQIETTTNILFSNGLLDPWSGTGVLKSISKDLQAVIIKEGAHHIDLMFSTPQDPPSVIQARQTELKAIEKWIMLAYHRHHKLFKNLQHN